MRRRAAAIALGLLLWASPAAATYSPPLTRVRIDAQRAEHTPSLVYASERRTTAATDLELSGWGGQYLGQFDFDFGFGFQVGAAAGYADVDGLVGRLALGGVDVETNGYWVGGQLRVYQMLYQSDVGDTGARPSAITAFVNLRTLFYDTSDRAAQVDLQFFNLTGGLGLMAEWSVHDYVSICPYAWITPGLVADLDYQVGASRFEADLGPTLRSPFLVGLDVWIYLFPNDWDSHLSLSVLGSFVDTEGDDTAIAAVVGYTF